MNDHNKPDGDENAPAIVDRIPMPSKWKRWRRRLNQWTWRRPISSWVSQPSRTDYAWNYHTPQEDLVRRDSMLDWAHATQAHPTIPLRSKNEPRNLADDRDTPYFLRGRNHEFNHLAQRIVYQPSGISLITGPPGVGKTALLHTLREYARRQGYIVIDLLAECFEDTPTLCQTIRKKALPDDIVGLRGSYTIETGLKIGVKPPNVEASLGTQNAETRREIGEAMIMETLTDILAEKPHAPGILLTCDEAQNIASEILDEPKNPSWKTIKNNFVTLNDAVLRAGSSIPITTILAGVPPAKQVYEKALSRSATGSYIHLRPITTEPCAQIIRDHIHITDKTGASPIAYDEEDIQRWAHECKGHVLHATNAGQILQEQGIILAEKQATLTERDKQHHIKTINRLINDRNKEYYEQQIDNVTNEELALHLIAAASANPQGAIPQGTAKAIVTHVLRKNNLNHSKEDIIKAIRPLQRYGLIQTMRKGSHFIHAQPGENTPKYWEVAIPSLQTFIKNDIENAKTLKEITQSIAPIMQDAQYDHLPWDWSYKPALAKLPRINDPHVTYPNEPQTATTPKK